MEVMQEQRVRHKEDQRGGRCCGSQRCHPVTALEHAGQPHARTPGGLGRAAGRAVWDMLRHR
eukprot:364258-Chlamydomonas_euryale.AAC.2